MPPVLVLIPIFSYKIDCGCQHSPGTIGRDCDSITGQCVCAEGYIGKQCDNCSIGYYGSSICSCTYLIIYTLHFLLVHDSLQVKCQLLDYL